MSLYPLRFRPHLVPKVWGGRALSTLLQRDLPGGPDEAYGESWELADLPEHRSVVSNGPLAGQRLHDVIAAHGEKLLGRLSLDASGDFPLLVKYLDAKAPLSVQVHPDAAWCRTHEAARFKSEAWYVLHAEPDSVIYKGLRENIAVDDLRPLIAEGRVEEALIAVPARAGHVHYLPAGTCHAIGAGVVVAEIQTPSDTTYRLFDWGRTNRALHVDQALACMHAGPVNARKEERRSHVAGMFTAVSRICSCEYFQIEKVRMVEEFGLEIPYDRPAVWIVLSGHGRISRTPAKVDVAFKAGDVMLIPAGMEDARVDLDADTVWLDIQFPSLLANEIV